MPLSPTPVMPQQANSYKHLDGARVSWSLPQLICDCAEGSTSACTHIRETLRERMDRIDEDLDSVDILVTMRQNLPNEAFFLPVGVGELLDGQRAIGAAPLFRQGSGKLVDQAELPNILGYIGPHASRVEIHEMLWPYLVRAAYRYPCLKCKMPAKGKVSAANAVSSWLHLVLDTTDHRCPKCTFSDLVPNVDKNGGLAFDVLTGIDPAGWRDIVTQEALFLARYKQQSFVSVTSS